MPKKFTDPPMTPTYPLPPERVGFVMIDPLAYDTAESMSYDEVVVPWGVEPYEDCIAAALAQGMQFYQYGRSTAYAN